MAVFFFCAYQFVCHTDDTFFLKCLRILEFLGLGNTGQRQERGSSETVLL